MRLLFIGFCVYALSFVWLLPLLPLLSSSFSVCLVQLLFSTSLGYFMLLCCTAAAATAAVFCCFFLGYLPSFLRHQWQHLGAAKLAVFFARFLFVQLKSLTRSLLLELCWCTYYLPTYLPLFVSVPQFSAFGFSRLRRLLFSRDFPIKCTALALVWCYCVVLIKFAAVGAAEFCKRLRCSTQRKAIER